jgi:hypothetical protein
VTEIKSGQSQRERGVLLSNLLRSKTDRIQQGVDDMMMVFKTGPMREANKDNNFLESRWVPSTTAMLSKSVFQPGAERAALMTICQQRVTALQSKDTMLAANTEERVFTANGWAAVFQATTNCVRKYGQDQGYDLGLIWAILSRLLMDIFGENGLRRLRAVVASTEAKEYEKPWMPKYGALGPATRFTQVKDPDLQRQLRTICATYNMLWSMVGQGGKLRKKTTDSFKQEQVTRMLSARFVRELKVLKRSVKTDKREYDAPVVKAMLQVVQPVKVPLKGTKPRNRVNKKATFDSTLQRMLLGAGKGVKSRGHEGEGWLASGKPKFEGEVWNLLLVVGGSAMVSMARREWVEKQ